MITDRGQGGGWGPQLRGRFGCGCRAGEGWVGGWVGGEGRGVELPQKLGRGGGEGGVTQRWYRWEWWQLHRRVDEAELRMSASISAGKME